MRFYFSVLFAGLVLWQAVPVQASPVYVHSKPRKVKKHKGVKHRSLNA